MASKVAQVGGDHYAAEYQHWDWAEDVRLGNMEYAATKYIIRWRKKDGLKDLKKARSYVQKLIELHNNKNRKNPANFIAGAFDRFCTQNVVIGRERDVCLMLTYWNNEQRLLDVVAVINDIIFDNFPEEFASKLNADVNGLTLDASGAATYDPNEGDEDEHVIEPQTEALL